MKDHPEIVDLIRQIGCDEMENIWEELGHGTARPYFDANEEDCFYVIGKDLGGMSFAAIQQLDTTEANQEIDAFCAMFQLPRRKSDMVCLASCW